MYATADLMKVFMIPKMMEHMSIFTPRVIAFNETFAPLTCSCSKKGLAVVWEESTAGRTREDLANTYVQFLKIHRDAREICIWADNYASQNKNWLLFTTLLRWVHREDVATQTITIKYLEKGHTFMASDAQHASAGQKLKRQRTVLDIEDFAACCKTGCMVCKTLLHGSTGVETRLDSSTTGWQTSSNTSTY